MHFYHSTDDIWYCKHSIDVLYKEPSFVKNIRLFRYVRIIELSFFLIYMKVETRSGYPSNCNRVPGS